MTGTRAPDHDPLAAFDGAVFLKNGVLFTRALRSAGIPTSLGGALDFARALTLVDIGDRTQVHAAGSAIFCHRHADLPVYDAVFDQFWRRHVARIAPTALRAEASKHQPEERDQATIAPDSSAERQGRRTGRPGQAEPSDADEGEHEIGEGRVVSPRAYSTVEAFSHRRLDERRSSRTQPRVSVLQRHADSWHTLVTHGGRQTSRPMRERSTRCPRTSRCHDARSSLACC